MAEALSEEQHAFVQGRTKASKQVSKEERKIDNPRLVTFSSKMEEDLWNALRTVALERKIAKMTPSSQQDIINLAVQEWLQRNDHLNESH